MSTPSDRVHSTPPTNTSVDTPSEWPAESVGAANPAGLARQNREREKALRRIAKLRLKASAEIDRLLAFMDASDPYAATELEEQVDNGPCDDNELDGPENGEDEESDPAEPSLGSVNVSEWSNQERWAAGNRHDLEDEHDGAEPDEADLEPA